MAINNIKFQPPSRSGHAISRKKLLRTLDQHYRLLICHAPAGFGKTTFMTEYLQLLKESGAHAVWYSLDESDNDLVRFINGIQHALAAQEVSRDSQVTENSGESTDTWDWLITALSDTTVPKYLFLDNFEVINDPIILDTLSMVFQRLPEDRQVIIGSRRKTELQYSKLSLNNEACIFRADDFRFSEDESRTFFEHQNLNADLNTSKMTFIDQLNGWATAHQICALQLKHDNTLMENPLGSLTKDEILADYIAENVLNTLDSELVSFLLHTCLLNSLDPSICNSLTGNDNAKTLLEKLYSEDLFIQKIQTDPPQYRYHKLFSEILYKYQCKTNPDGIEEFHRSYYKALIKHQRPEDAINHALEFNDPSLAATLIKEQALQAIYRSEIRRVLSWIEALPDTELKKSPELLLAHAWAAAFTHNYAAAKESIEYLEKNKKDIDATNDIIYRLPTTKVFYQISTGQFEGIERAILKYLKVIPHDAHFERTGIHNLLCYLYVLQNRFESARKILLTTQSLKIEQTRQFTVTYSYALLGVIQFLQGDLTNAQTTLETGHHITKDFPGGNSIAQATTTPILAAVLYERNRVEEAKDILEKHLPIIRNNQISDWISCAYITLSKCHFAEGNYPQSQRLIDDLERIGHGNDDDRMVYTAQKELVNFHQRLGQLEKANLVNQSIDVMDSSFKGAQQSHFPTDIEANDITDIRQAILTKKFDEAEQRILIARKKTHSQRQLRLWKISIMEALLNAEKGRLTNASNHLIDILGAPGANQLYRLFIDEGERIKQILENATSCTNNDDTIVTINTLLSSFPQRTQSGPTNTPPALIESLTKRELELLKLVAGGHSNKSIADQTFVSESTVKWHLGNVFSKLGVKKRTQAIMTGRQLGLID